MNKYKGVILWLIATVAAAFIALQCIPPETRSEENIIEDQGQVGNWTTDSEGWSDNGHGSGSYVAAKSWNALAPQVDFTVTTVADGNGNVLPGEELAWLYSLNYSDIIMAPGGQALLSMIPLPGPNQGFPQPGLSLVIAQLPDGKVTSFPQINDSRRINFSQSGAHAYVLNEQGTEVTRIALDTMNITGIHQLDAAYTVISVSPDDARVVASNVPRTSKEQINYHDISACLPPMDYQLPAGADLCRASVVELDTGDVWGLDLPRPIRDIDFLVEADEMVVTYGSPAGTGESKRAVIQFYSMQTRKPGKSLMFPNCADEFVVVPGEDLALLSPTYCSSVNADKPVGQWTEIENVDQPHGSSDVPVPPPPPPPATTTTSEFPDPISLIDLQGKQFIRNLPGFGPVALSPDGTKAVGFTRKELLEEQWHYHLQSTPYGIVVIDLPTQAWDVVDFGPNMPAYFIGPDSAVAGAYSYVHSCQCTEQLTSSWDKSCFGEDYLDCRDTCCSDCCSESKQANFQWIDLNTVTATPMTGLPTSPMRDFAWDPHGGFLYGLWDQSIRKMTVGSNASEVLGLGRWPEMIAARPQGDLLVLADAEEPRFQLYDMANDEVANELDLNVMEALVHIAVALDTPPPTPEQVAMGQDVATAVRITDVTFAGTAAKCTEFPGADLASVTLTKDNDDFTSESVSAVWHVSDDSHCSTNEQDDFDVLLTSGFWTDAVSLNGRSVVLLFDPDVAIERGDWLTIREVESFTEADPQQDKYEVELAVYDAESETTNWVSLALLASGQNTYNVDW